MSDNYPKGHGSSHAGTTAGTTAGPYVTITDTGTGYSTTAYPNYTVGGYGSSYQTDMIISGKLTVGEIDIDGANLNETLSKILKRLALLETPTPEKLEKFAALRDLYDQYKMMEALCYEEKPKDK